MLRGLIWFWRLNLAVVLGSAVAAAVLSGALLVGDSVRGSLRDILLDRLGRIDHLVVAERFFREDLGGDLTGGGRAPDGLEAVPAIILRGSATHGSSPARASGVTVLGVDHRFAALYPPVDGPADGGLGFPSSASGSFPPVIVNESLRRELEARVGEAILLFFERADDIPRASLAGRRDPVEVLGTLRATLAGVIPDRGPGRFGLSPHQGAPLNAFLPLTVLQRALGRSARVNTLLVSETAEGRASGSPADVGRLLADAARLEDLGLTLRQTPGFVVLESREFLLRPAAVATIEKVAEALGAPLQRLQTYLARTIRRGDRTIPYSMLTALGGATGDPLPALLLPGGAAAPPISDDGILLNTWAAGDLEARPGDEVEISYFVVGPDDGLETATARLRVEGVVALAGLGADRSLTPDYPGIQDARRMSSWDPPFPVDLDLIRPRDETYWEKHRATPKGFVSLETGERLWSNRYGTLTSVRVGVPPGSEAPAFAAGVRSALLRRLDPALFGFRVQPVRQEGLRAAAGATDFSALFLGFSMFLIASAALLAALLFRLGVEQRAREIGLLLAVGYPVRAVRRRFLSEGGILAAAGVLLGVAGGVAYAGLMMTALRTIWLPAVGSPLLFLHVRPASLALGGLISFGVVLASIASSIRRLGRVPAAALLAGSMKPGDDRGAAGRTARLLTAGGLALAVALPLTAFLTGRTSSPTLAFGAGTSLLVAGLAGFALWCRRARPGGLARTGLGGPAPLALMAARNSAWNPGRSILSVALVGCACFVIVTVAAHRGTPEEGLGPRHSGSGGYALVAAADIPLHQDLNRPEGRADLGFPAADPEQLASVEVVPFRLLPGDDASCLNLYRPGRPQILGVPPAQIRRGGFRFQSLSGEAENPWTLLEQDLGPGVVPAFGDANSVLWILHLGLGKDLVVQDERGREVRLRFVGLLQRSVFQSEVLIAGDRFLELFPSHSGFAYFLVDAPAAKTAGVRRLLEGTLRPYGFDVTTVAKKLAGYRAVENTYLSTFQTLGGLGLLLGTLGLGIVLVRNVLERRGELATLRAFGFRRWQLVVMVLAENGFLLSLGLLLGGVSALLAVAPHLAAAGSAVPWISLLSTLAGVALTGMLASLAAVRGALRVPLLGLLKAER